MFLSPFAHVYLTLRERSDLQALTWLARQVGAVRPGAGPQRLVTTPLCARPCQRGCLASVRAGEHGSFWASEPGSGRPRAVCATLKAWQEPDILMMRRGMSSAAAEELKNGILLGESLIMNIMRLGLLRVSPNEEEHDKGSALR